MKSWPDARSPWGRQVRFDDHEFEAMMDELRLRAVVPGQPSKPPIDVDRILLRGFELEADYVALPHGVLGRTVFERDGTVRIEIARELAEQAETDATARRRLRTTLAHECGHVACHRSLFELETQALSLFPRISTARATTESPTMCRQETIGCRRYNGEWWEFQANQCMAALLMPRRMFSESVRVAMDECGCSMFDEVLRRGQEMDVLMRLSDRYDVSQTATLIRLQTLGFVANGTQGSLRLTD